MNIVKVLWQKTSVRANCWLCIVFSFSINSTAHFLHLITPNSREKEDICEKQRLELNEGRKKGIIWPYGQEGSKADRPMTKKDPIKSD